MKKMKFGGMDLVIEVPAGGTRTGTDRAGKRWEQKLSSGYGYIMGTNSPDGEKLDCYLSSKPSEGSDVYVIHQLTPDGEKYDEDKVMLGFPSRKSAESAFKRECHDPEKMFGGMSEFSFDHFKVIAYQASKSKAILANQDVYDEISDKLPRGVRDPVSVAKRVSEGYCVRSVMTGIGISGLMFDGLEDAERAHVNLGPAGKLYEVAYVGSSAGKRALLEGLSQGDLEGILVPRISVDEYVPKDEDSGNIVIAFFVRNDPTAVEPLRMFCDKCEGVDETDSGDSDSMKNTSIVYVEFDKGFKIEDVERMVDQVAMTAGLESGDFSLKFPDTSDLVPYDADVIKAYFVSRSLKGVFKS